MKIKISSQKINFRISHAECVALTHGASLMEKISFPDKTILKFKAEAFEMESHVQLIRRYDEVLIKCSQSSLLELMGYFPRQVGLYGETPLNEEIVKYSIEIDLKRGPKIK